MKTAEKFDGLRVPDYALSYLVNGDDSGITEEDKAAIDKWFAIFTRRAAALGGNAVFSIASSEEGKDPYFTRNPVFGLACNVIDCEVAILVDDKPKLLGWIDLVDKNNRRSTLGINGRYDAESQWLCVTGNLEHCAYIRPHLERDRDALVKYLLALDYGLVCNCATCLESRRSEKPCNCDACQSGSGH